ncbi:hypothetical protein [Deinococcus sp.]|uniref:hypothetical protein n=1 Tax=Deinococcus sp. TaxID=47478 RepID=UPI003CC62089
MYYLDLNAVNTKVTGTLKIVAIYSPSELKLSRRVYPVTGTREGTALNLTLSGAALTLKGCTPPEKPPVLELKASTPAAFQALVTKFEANAASLRAMRNPK